MGTNFCCGVQVVDLRDNNACGAKGKTALDGLTRMKMKLELRL